ncbi:hypothetical protein Rsub_02429 [Raphidocelis subcapitata]|uniref:Glycoside-hydrolase family GH114 TIM-barrel domain-containing protein n=1 Tax=Raphidocelis subcapitata TaxID=307507 RepID=A0A2V0NXM9_9CHLO|nr:hypothetical protein Rsub_02429 [Raphidocelis subcapitata]|eukprot:GBF90323.1 hypothetical protein Rsub_02429 [Raphidocelis subcapitata]
MQLAASLLVLAAPASAWWQPNTAGGPITFDYLLGVDPFIPSKHIKAGIQVYFLDGNNTSPESVAAIHAAGAKAVCYFSAGSWEMDRPDAGLFPPSVIGNTMNGWAREKWLNISSPLIRPIMKARMKECQAKGFDGVDPDNVDVWTNKQEAGFPQLTGMDQFKYNSWLSSTAHGLGLAAGLKNDLDQVKSLEPKFDFFVNEQCGEFEECGKYLPAKLVSKPLFNVEYNAQGFIRSCRCQSKLGLQSIKKTLDLVIGMSKCSATYLNNNCPFA